LIRFYVEIAALTDFGGFVCGSMGKGCPERSGQRPLLICVQNGVFIWKVELCSAEAEICVWLDEKTLAPIGHDLRTIGFAVRGFL